MNPIRVSEPGVCPVQVTRIGLLNLGIGVGADMAPNAMAARSVAKTAAAARGFLVFIWECFLVDDV
jgi:Na+/proline symporter